MRHRPYAASSREEPIRMRTFVTRQPEFLDIVRTRRGSFAAAPRRAMFSATAALFAAQALLGLTLTAQTPSAPAQPHSAVHSATKQRTSAIKPVAHSSAHKRRKTAKSATKAATSPVAIATPPVPLAPPLPNWPVNNKPAEATVVWDSRGLLIQASNSSLDQILKDVSLKTGVKVEGIGADERIFGTYGPGPARDVLSQLLDGSGYNILMVGDQGEGTPRRIVLSGRPNGPAPPPGNPNPVVSNDNDAENDQDSEARQFEPNPVLPPVPGGPGVPARAQQMMEERQRAIQQQIRQQQANQQDQQN